MQTILKAADAADLLALVPVLAGYRPRDSLVLVLFSGSRSVGVMRFDLPPADADAAAIAADCIGLVCRVEVADAIVVVVYTDDSALSSDGTLAGAALATAIGRCARAGGIELKDALVVGNDGWAEHPSAATSPPAAVVVHPLAEIARREDDPAVRAMPVQADQSAAATLPPAPRGIRGRVREALAELDRALAALHAAPPAPPDPCRLREDADAEAERLGVDPRAMAAACALDDVPELFEDALDWSDPLDAYRLAPLLWCLRKPALRDVALLQWCDGIEAGDAALDAQLRWELGEDYPEAGGERFWGEGARPDPGRLERARDLARRVAAASPRHDRPGPLTAAAWLSWALGGSTHAAWYADQALQIDPDYGMAQIVLTMVSAGHLPAWAFVRERTT